MSLLLTAVALAVLLGMAMRFDLSTRRIPNRLVAAGILIGLSWPVGLMASGATVSSMVGPGSAVLGLLTGLFIFLPFHALRVLGAGDVKLMAMVGTWLGPAATLQAAVYIVLAGGVLAVVTACWTGTVRQVLRNVLGMILARTAVPVPGSRESPALSARPMPRTNGRLPYAVAIAAGTATQLVVMFTTHPL
ncbi:MAG: prepilin peptidase [Caldimonas sp.]|jgi:prepilin peptidase CpaA|uniref:A24 family peptidase n=1 Tax=Caldimonas sp. TaxID=2838790 RepID=UPI00391A8CDD